LKCKSDLFLRVNVKHDTRKAHFNIKENNVHCEYYLTISQVRLLLNQAILGGTFKVNTLEGVIEHNFPSGLKHDEYYVIKGKGIAKPNNGKGDLHLLIKIVYPDNDKYAKGIIDKLYKKNVKNDI
jgi:DnaJ-class molecular chaperone